MKSVSVEELRTQFPHLIIRERSDPGAPRNALDDYCLERIGTAASLVKLTGISAAEISKYRANKAPILLPQAILLERATNGMLRAEVLSPKNAELISYLRGSRA